MGWWFHLLINGIHIWGTKKPHWSVLTSVPHLCGWQTAEGIDQTELMKTHPQTELMEAYGGVDPLVNIAIQWIIKIGNHVFFQGSASSNLSMFCFWGGYCIYIYIHQSYLYIIYIYIFTPYVNKSKKITCVHVYIMYIYYYVTTWW